MSDNEDDLALEVEGNPFADIEEYIEDTNAIVPPTVGAATFKVEHGLILMLKAEGFFRNSTDDDLTQHLRNFLVVCSMHKQNNVSDDALRLRCFKYSLAGEARKWLQNLPSNSIHSWPELVRAFLSKWFPQSKKSELRDKIFFFKQQPGEQLHEAWERFNLYLVRSPNHGFLDSILMENFYMGLDPMNHSIAKNAAAGSFMDKSFAKITQILDTMAKHNQAWHSEDSTGGITIGSTSLSNLIKENHERDQAIPEIATNVNLLTKLVIENQKKSINAVENIPSMPMDEFEEANYINNAQEGYQRQQWRPNPQGTWRTDPQGAPQGNWNNNNTAHRSNNPYVPPRGPNVNPGHSGDSKLESMLERIIQNQERSDTSMKNMTEIVGSHTAAIQKLEIQMRDLSREQYQPQKGKLPSDTMVNPKGHEGASTSQVMSITTRSGKTVKSPIEVPVETKKEEVEEHNTPAEIQIQGEKGEEPAKKVVENKSHPPQLPRPPPPFPQRLGKKIDEHKFAKFYDILKQLSMNIPFLEAFQEMPGFAKYLKDHAQMESEISLEHCAITELV